MNYNTLHKLLIMLFLSLVAVGKITAQSDPDSTAKLRLQDARLSEGFDEAALIKQLQKGHVPLRNYAEIIAGRKRQYIESKKGISKPSPYFPETPAAPASTCMNDFESGTFAYWTGATGYCSSSPVSWTTGIIAGPPNTPETNSGSQHDILNHPAGYDHHAGLTGGIPNIPYIAPGGGAVSVRLGNSVSGWGTEKLVRNFMVTPANNFFSYKYAVVLQAPSSHSESEQPFFRIDMYASGTLINDPCLTYEINGLEASSGNDPSFVAFPDIDSDGNSVTSYYKKWTDNIVDLTPYMGQTVRIEFITQDCTLGAHYGYAYIDANCEQLQSQMSYCQGDSTGVLVAPTGYPGYQWYNGAGTLLPGETSNVLTVLHPVSGAGYFVRVKGNNDCYLTLTGTLSADSTSAIFNTTALRPSCKDYSDGLAYVVQSSGGAPFTYTWTNAAGTVLTPAGSPDSLTNLAAGMYTVTVQSSTGCTVTNSVQVPPTPAVLNYQSTPICPNDPQITITSQPGSGYQWFGPDNQPIAGANDSAYTVVAPSTSQNYTVHYMPASGCAIDLVNAFYLYTVNPPPYAVTNVNCYGSNTGSAVVYAPSSSPAGAAGPYTYSWTYAGSSSVISASDSASGLFAGSYSVTATSAGGCSVTTPVIITEQPSHYDSLKITTNYCPGDDPIVLHAPPGYSSYAWYANPNATGPVLSTDDSVIVYQPSLGLNYTLALPSIAPDSCDIIVKLKLEYALPPATPGFITKMNVFTPNEDGINDFFMLNKATLKYLGEFHIRIYDRWGILVFQSDDMNVQWDGRIDGVSSAQAVYYWIADYKQVCLENAPVQQAHGFVQVLR